MTDLAKRVEAVLPAFEGLRGDDAPITTHLKEQLPHGTVALELDEIEAIAARINELSEIVRQNALVSL